MPSFIEPSYKISDFLTFILNDKDGYVSSNYVMYIDCINKIMNNDHIEVENYNNFIKDYNVFPPVKNLQKQNYRLDNTTNLHKSFGVYLWYYIHH